MFRQALGQNRRPSPTALKVPLSKLITIFWWNIVQACPYSHSEGPFALHTGKWHVSLFMHKNDRIKSSGAVALLKQQVNVNWPEMLCHFHKLESKPSHWVDICSPQNISTIASLINPFTQLITKKKSGSSAWFRRIQEHSFSMDSLQIVAHSSTTPHCSFMVNDI